MQKFNPEIIVHVAAFSRGKPPKHSYGAVCSLPGGKALVSAAKFVGMVAKPEVADRALAWALAQAQFLKAEKIEIRVDDPDILTRLENKETLRALLGGFRFYRAVRLEPEHESRRLAEQAQRGWREIYKK